MQFTDNVAMSGVWYATIYNKLQVIENYDIALQISHKSEFLPARDYKDTDHYG